MVAARDAAVTFFFEVFAHSVAYGSGKLCFDQAGVDGQDGVRNGIVGGGRGSAFVLEGAGGRDSLVASVTLFDWAFCRVHCD